MAFSRCVTPGDYSSDPKIRNVLAEDAETAITGDILLHAGAGASDIWLDIQSMKGGVEKGFQRWLRRNFSGAGGDFASQKDKKVPDIAIPRPLPGLSEWYEVKPDSPSGRHLGEQKAKFLTPYLAARGIPLLAGKIYPANGKQLIILGPPTTGVWMHENFRAVLRYHVPGVVVYEICYSVRARIVVPEVSPETVKNMMFFLLAVFLFSRLGGLGGLFA